eukprot:835517-Amphidinium_carterae.2
MHQPTWQSILLKSWLALARLRKATTRVKHANKMRLLLRRQQLEQQLNDAWKIRDLATCWKLSRVITGAKLGKKNKLLGVADRCRPDANEWRKAVMRQGPEGGFGAYVALDAEDAIRFVRRQVPAPPPGFADDAWITAEQLVRGIRYHIHRAKNRRQPPSDDVPAELYDMLLSKNWRLYPGREGVGICNAFAKHTSEQLAAATTHGHSLMHPQVRFSKAMHETHIFTEVLTQLLTRSILAGMLPFQFNASQGFHVAKGNGKDGVDGRRLLHGLPPVSKALMRCAFEEVGGDVPPYAYGAVRGRTREEAISIQLILEYRCRKARLCSVLCLYDVSNAFPSMSRASLAKVVAKCKHPIKRSMLHQHHACAICMLPCDDETIFFCPASGIFPGSSVATNMFNEAIWDDVVDPWLADTSHLCPDLICPSVVTDLPIDVGTTLFVDDISRRIVSTNLNEIEVIADEVDANLKLHSQKVNLHTNDSKKATLLSLAGVGSHRDAIGLQQRLQQGGKSSLGEPVRQSRYLGPQLHYMSSFTPERERRIAATKRIFAIYWRFWMSDADIRLKRLVFQSVVMSTLFSAVSSFVLANRDYQIFDGVLAAMLRKLMKGNACKKQNLEDGTVKYKAMSNIAVLGWAWLGSSKIEICILRLRLFQRVCAQPREHEQFLTVFLGALPSSRPTAYDHPWLLQLQGDIELLLHLDGYDQVFLEALRDPKVLLTPCEAHDCFVGLDVSQLRVLYLHSPEFQEHCKGTAFRNDLPLDYVCTFQTPEGATCNKSFSSRRALLRHRSCQHGTLTIGSLVKSCICPWCSTVLSSRTAACNHVRNAALRGHCKISLSNAQQIRLVKSACICTVLVSADSKYVTAMKAATAKYMETGQDMSREQKVQQHSLPHAHAWNAALLVLKATSEQNKTKVETYSTQIMKAGGMHVYCNHVKVFKVAKAYDKTKLKIEASITEGTDEAHLFQLMISDLNADGGKVLQGTAPPGALERTLQTYLDSGTPQR